MISSNDGHKFDRRQWEAPQQRPVHEHHRQQTDHARSVEDQLSRSSERFDVDTRRNGRESLGECAQCCDDLRHREHRIHYDRQFGLKPAGEAARGIAERPRFLSDAPRANQQGATSFGQLGSISRPIEQQQAVLRLQLLDAVGHRRLGAVQRLGGL